MSKLEGYRLDKQVLASYIELQTRWIVGSIPFHKNKVSDISFYTKEEKQLNISEEDIRIANEVSEILRKQRGTLWN